MKFLVLLASLALPALVHAQTRYTITNVGPGGFDAAINASGTIVTTINNQAVIYSGGSASPVPGLTLPATDIVSSIAGINASGAVAGTSRDANGRFSAFIVAGGVLTNLGRGVAGGINDAGTVAVYGGGVSNSGDHLRSASGVITPLPAPFDGALYLYGLNEAGTAVGYFSGDQGHRAVLATRAGLTQLGTLPGGRQSEAYAINSAGAAVGFSTTQGLNERRAALFSGGTVTNLDPTGTSGSVAYAINSAGTVVGDGASILNGRPTFVYTAATGLVDLSTLVNNLAASGFTSLLLARAINDAGQIVGFGTVGGVTRMFRLDPVAGPAVPPAITTQPAALTVAAGASATFSVAATGSPTPTYQWRRDGTNIAGATAATLTLNNLTTANAGTYTVVASNATGSVTSNAAVLVVAPLSTVARLSNLSILTSLAGANDSFTLGYVVGGAGTSGTKPLVIRAVGPSLTPLGVGGALANPKLETFAGATKTGENDNWGGGTALFNAMDAVGAFRFTGPTSLDAAVATSVALGDNSVKVTPVGNLSGAVIAEIYDGHPTAAFSVATPRLVNVSVLKNIGTSLTAGFVIGGTGSRTLLIRAVGPTLGAAPFNVPGTVADPQLALFNSASARIGENDNWGGTAALSAAFTAVGAFQLSGPTSRDAALLATLTPGNYTVQVSGVGGTTGTALVEVYEVP